MGFVSSARNHTPYEHSVTRFKARYKHLMLDLLIHRDDKGPLWRVPLWVARVPNGRVNKILQPRKARTKTVLRPYRTLNPKL